MARPVPAQVRALLEAHASAIPAELARAASASEPYPSLHAGASVVVTGVGASEGPARYLAFLLHLDGHRATFAPLSAFVLGGTTKLGEALVVFSQGLCPNARIALRCAPEHRAAFLFTSVATDRAAPDVRARLDAFTASGGRVVVLPPEAEAGTLLRVVGPTVAMYAAARFAAGHGGTAVDVDALARLPELAESAPHRVAEACASLPALALHRRIAFVTAGTGLEGAHGIRCKWLEGLGVSEPALWDVLQIAHGPFHQFFDEEMTLVTLEDAASPASAALFDRLASMLVPPRHALVRLVAALPGAMAALDHELLGTALLVRALQERSKDIGGALGADAPLYELGLEPP